MHSTKYVRASSSNTYILPSYDLELDQKLTEETTTLLESYTVSIHAWVTLWLLF